MQLNNLTVRLQPIWRSFKIARPHDIAMLAIVGIMLGGCATGLGQAQLPDPLAAGWQGKPVCEKLHDDVQQRILRCTFAPGVGHERHYHAPHFGYALVGGKSRITDASGTREVSFATGSSSAKADASWHEIVNIGDTTIVYLIVEPK